MSDHRKDPAPPPGREQRPYPHGTGDRNAWKPTHDDPMPVHEGGTQRRSPPDGETEDGHEDA